MPSDAYSKAKELAERLTSDRYRNRTRETCQRCNDLADNLRLKYGFDDSDVEYLISYYSLDSKY